MIFLRVVSILCGTAILLAFVADAAVYILVQRHGAIGFWVRKGTPPWFPSAFTFIFSLLWIAAFVIGLLIVKKFRVFPFGF